MSLTTLIADTRKAVAGDAGNAQAVFLGFDGTVRPGSPRSVSRSR